MLQTKRLALAERLYMPNIDPIQRDVLKEPDKLRKLIRVVNESAKRSITADVVLPSFLEFLISQNPSNPRDLVRRAVDLRDHDAIKRT